MTDLQTGAATGSTLLDYSLQSDPDPLTVGASATLTVVVSNGSNRLVTLDALAFAFPSGANAKDLTDDPAGLTVQTPDGWTASRVGGTVTLTPPPDGTRIGRDGLTFVFALSVNEQVGTAAVAITETTSEGSHQGALSVAKFPAGFTVSELTASPLIVEPGGATTLSWQGADLPGTSYTLEYGTVTKLGLPATDSVEVEDLQATTVFYLIVTATVRQQKVTIQRERTVTVSAPKILYFNGPEDAVLLKTATVLYWATSGSIARCDLLCDGAILERGVPTEATKSAGGFSVTPPTTSTVYELRAYGQDGAYVSLSLTVEAVYMQLGKTEKLTGAPERIVAQSDPPYVFVTNGSEGVVRVTPIAPFETTVLPLVSAPAYLGLSTDGKELYATCDEQLFAVDSTSGNVDVVDNAGGYSLVPAALATASAGSALCVLCLSSLNKGIAYFFFYDAKDPSEPSQGPQVNLRTSMWEASLGDLALSPDGASAYLMVLPSGLLYTVTVPASSSTDPISAPRYGFDANASAEPCACSLRVAPDGRLYLAGAGDCSTLLVLNPGAPVTLAKTLPLPAVDIAFNQDGSQALVVTTTGEAVLIETTTYTTLQTLALGGTPAQVVSLAVDGKQLYTVLDRKAASLRIIEEAIA